MAASEWTSNPSGVGLYHTLCRRMSAGMDDVHSFDCFTVAPLFVRIAVHKFQGQDGDRSKEVVGKKYQQCSNGLLATKTPAAIGSATPRGTLLANRATTLNADD